MNDRPRLLDLFCCAGGAGEGYRRAGFDVVGVDIKPQPRNPHTFIQGDALEYLAQHGHEFDAIHASPPCQAHSIVTGRNRRATADHETGWLLGATVDLLAKFGRPWVVENVETAKFDDSVYRIKLCGSMFGLNVRRHRWFASNGLVMAPDCEHGRQAARFRTLDSRRPGSLATVIGVHGHLNYPGEFKMRCEAMGIDWMKNDELSQAIPPAYTEFIGKQLLKQIQPAKST